MQLTDLVQTIAKGIRPTALLQGQFEFQIDRRNRRIASRVEGWMLDRETIRIQTDRPFIWGGEITLPDSSIGQLRALRCRVEAQGRVPATEEDARGVMGLLLQDDFDHDKMFRRFLSKAIASLNQSLRGRFLETLQGNTALLETSIAGSLNASGLHVASVVLHAICYDATRPTLDLTDTEGGIEVRSSGGLEANRMTYKARLKWGQEREQILGMLAYGGTIEGRDPGPALDRPLEPAQIQPLEAWFRRLLAEALSAETTAPLVAGDPATLARVRARVSKALGRGTGRVLDTLVVYPVLANLQRENERAAQFRENYPVIGVPGELLWMEHAIRFVMVERDRWLAQNAPDPEAFLRREVTEATRLFLHDRRFEDIVTLYLSPGGQKLLSEAVEKRVRPIAATIGYELVSNTTILSIPEHEFIEGREIPLPAQSYKLSEPNLEAALQLSVSVIVIDGAQFARALARQDHFVSQIETAIDQIARAFFRECSGLDYYSSPYVNGLSLSSDSVPRGSKDAAATLDHDPFGTRLRGRLDQMLFQRFGLKVTHLSVVPGPDKVIARMREVTALPFRYHLEQQKFDRGEGRPPIRMDVKATIFIRGLAQENWQSFYHGVDRYPTIGAFQAEIGEMLTQVLRMMETAAMSPDRRKTLASEDLRGRLIDHFTQRMRDEYGLDARLYPLELRFDIPRTNIAGQLVISSLEDEIRNILNQRRALRDDATQDADYEREKLNRRLKAARAELDEEVSSHDTATDETIVVRVQQNLLTGRIEAS